MARACSAQGHFYCYKNHNVCANGLVTQICHLTSWWIDIFFYGCWYMDPFKCNTSLFGCHYTSFAVFILFEEFG